MYDHYVIRTWEHRGEIQKEPYKREIVPLLGPERRGVDSMNVGVTHIDTKMGTQYHKHVIDELIYIVSGRGKVIIDKYRYNLEPGMVIFFPKDVFHQVRNTGAETLNLFNVFAPGMVRELQRQKTTIADLPSEAEIEER